MSRVIRFLAVLALALGLSACAGSPKSEGCCPMGASGSADKGKAMTCEHCEKKDKAACCCSKGAADGRPGEGHQH